MPAPAPPARGGSRGRDQQWWGTLRTIWGGDGRYRETYGSRYAEQGYYFAGDGAKYDDDGAIWLLGRVDDVMNISGHRISTTEVESALVSHPTVAEAAVVGAPDPITGQGIVPLGIMRGHVAECEAPGEQANKAPRNQAANPSGPNAEPRTTPGDRDQRPRRASPRPPQSSPRRAPPRAARPCPLRPSWLLILPTTCRCIAAAWRSWMSCSTWVTIRNSSCCTPPFRCWCRAHDW